MQRFEGMAELEDIYLGELGWVMLWCEGEKVYLNLVSKVNQHDSARLLFPTSAVETDRSNHIHASTLDEVIHGRKLEDLDAAIDDGLGYLELIRQRLHDTFP